MRRLIAICLTVVLFHIAAPAIESNSQPPPKLFQPEPCSVQWCGPAYRYHQAGWIVLHIEGEPHERGVQHGKLMWREIEKYLQCMSLQYSSKSPSDAWRGLRTLVNATLLRRFDKEYLEEMQGIADGASAAGGRFDGRNIDLLDITVLNVWAELMTLDGALEALPTGLEGARYPDAQPPTPRKRKGDHCSAFAATGPATADGKIVFGHITMFGLYPCSFFNVWIDVKPTKGHRLLMQGYPGAMQSGLDYYINDAGMLCCETTIQQTRYEINGQSETSQIRKALQYGDSIDSVVEILKQPGSGLYANEWLLGDTKTNEIAMFEHGTHAQKLYRSSKNEWFGGTEGFYWGCNNVKDRAVRLETVATVNDRPHNLVYHPHDRDSLWVALYEKHKGHIDASFGREVFSTPPIVSYSSCDAKFTTSDMAKELKTWAIFGPPLGRSWQPSQWEREHFPAIQPLVSNPLTVLTANPPQVSTVPLAVDLGGKRSDNGGGYDGHSAYPAWRGTLFPKTDGDIWLAVAFAEYEGMFNRERAQAAAAPDRCLCAADKRKSSKDMLSQRVAYLDAVRNGPDAPLLEIKNIPDNDTPYRIAQSKGFMLLHELRSILGDKLFAETLDSFGTQNAGKDVSSADFVAHVEKAAGKSLKPFFDYWLTQKGLPRLKLESASVRAGNTGEKAFVVEGVVSTEGGPLPTLLDVTLESAKGETTTTLKPGGTSWKFKVDSSEKPIRVSIDKYGRASIANGQAFTLSTFSHALTKTLIVYGTTDEAASNAEAAEEMQKAIIRRGSNITVPIRSDRDVTDAELSSHHLLLIGRPDCNRVSRDFAGAFRVTFGPSSFRVGQDTYAHPGSAVTALATNPRSPQYSAILIAGLGAASTFALAPKIGQGEGGNSEITIFENGGGVHQIVLPAAELQKELEGK